ncbi:MAG: hypothetical protein PWP08_8 [Methanofollis sp.]|nr:hypothetical protein [Methanofollis sp.]
MKRHRDQIGAPGAGPDRHRTAAFPKQNLTRAADGISLSCDTPAGTDPTLVIRFSGSSEWRLPGRSYNAGTDRTLAETPAEERWRNVAGPLAAGEGRYFHRD